MVQIPDPQSHTVLAIWTAYENKSNNGDSLGIPMSMIANECERAIWYSFRWAPEPEPRSGQRQRRFDTGLREEERLLDDLENAGVIITRLDPETGSQFRVQLANGWLRGRIDALANNVPEAPKTTHVVECKSHNDKSFKELWKRRLQAGKPDHYAQCQAYMRAKSLTRCLYIAVNKNTDEIYVERVHYNKEFGDAIERKAERIVRTDLAPPKLFEDPKAKGAYICSWCRAADICHAGEFSRRNCRTCISCSFEDGAIVRCNLHNRELTYRDQQQGCPQHLFLPSLVPGEQLDADEDGRWIKYRLRDGSEWINGGGQ